MDGHEMTDEEFRAACLAKTAEIRRTGKTWPWPDRKQRSVRRRPARLRAQGTALLALWVIALAALVLVLASCSSTAPRATATPAAAAPPVTTAPAATAPATVAPSPDGTFTGSCDYTLGSDPANGTAQAIGDIDAANTGNVGITVKLTITWPQEGHSPLRLSKTVRIPRGGEQDVQFSRPLSYDQISALQSYQTGHDYADGCTYNGSMTATFGSPAG